MLCVLLLVSAFIIASINGQNCILGRTDLQPTMPVSMRGLYIQDQSRAPCDGQIIRWTICYYNPLLLSSKVFEISLEVWRNETLGELHMVDSNSVRVDVSDNVSYYQCEDVVVDPEDRINVQENDFLAVYMESIDTLPIVTANAGGTGRLLFVPLSSPPRPVCISGEERPPTLQLTNHALHIAATSKSDTSGGLSLVTTSELNPNSSSTTDQEEFAANDELSNMNTGKSTAALSVTVIVVIIVTSAITVIVIVVVIVIVLMWKKKKSVKTKKLHIKGTRYVRRSKRKQKDIFPKPLYSTTFNHSATCGENQNSFIVMANSSYGSQYIRRNQNIENLDITTSFNTAYTQGLRDTERNKNQEETTVPDNDCSYDYI